MHAWWVPPGLRGYKKSWLGADLLAGLTLVAVALPGQMATARLAGLPAVIGLDAFVAGSVVYALAGARRRLSVGADSTIAPVLATGVAAVAAVGTAGYGAVMAMTALLVGAALILVGLLRLGWISEFLSTPVITGVLAGIAVEIVIRQIPVILGVSDAGTTTIGRIRGLAGQLSHINAWTVAIAAGVLVVIAIVQRISRRLPGTLVALILSIVAVDSLGLASRHHVAVLGAVQGGLPHVRLPAVSWAQLRRLPTLVITVTFVCVAQTAATIRAAATRATRAAPGSAGTDPAATRTAGTDTAATGQAAAPTAGTSHAGTSHAGTSHAGTSHAATAVAGTGSFALPDDFNRDLIAIGGGSLAAGFIGAFPVDASPPNTAIVVASGGRSQLANITAAAVVFVVVLCLTGPLAKLPEAMLAATLVYIATRLFRGGQLAAIFRFDRVEFGLAVVALLVVAVVGIEQGVGVALVLSLADRTRRSARPRDAVLGREPGTDHWIPADIGLTTEQVPGILVYLVYAPVWYGNADYVKLRILHLAAATPGPVRAVVIDADAISDIDFTGLQSLRDLDIELKQRGVTLSIARVSHLVHHNLKHGQLLAQLGPDRVFASVDEAVAAMQRRG